MTDIAKRDEEDKLPIVYRKDLSTREKRACACWRWSKGDEVQFKILSKNSNLWHLLCVDKVRRYIQQEADKGNCLPLIMDKAEMQQGLTNKVRKYNNIDDMKHLSAISGHIPKDNKESATIIQINIVNNLGG